VATTAVPASRPLRAAGFAVAALLALVLSATVALGLVDRAAMADSTAIDEMLWQCVTVVAFGVPAVWMLVRAPRHPVGWLLASIPVALVLNGLGGVWSLFALAVHPLGGAEWGMTLNRFGVLSLPGLPLVLLLFPDGRLPSPRWRPLAVLTVVAAGVVAVLGFTAPARVIIQGSDAAHVPAAMRRLHDLTAVEGLPDAFWSVGRSLATLVDLLILLPAAASLVFRYRRAAAEQRAQLRWLIVAAIAMVCAATLSHLTSDVVSMVAWALGACAVATCLTVAVLRYRLGDVDFVINRTLVYAVLAGLLGVLYAGIVAAVSLISAGSVPSVAAAAVVAVSLAPLRSRLQGAADRWLRGARSDPYGVVSDLASRLEASGDAQDVLAATTETVARAFRATWVRVEVFGTDGVTAVAEHGSARAPAVELPVTYRGEVVGRLSMAAPPGGSLSASDRTLLADVVRQTGAVTAVVASTRSLQDARARLVTAREEERRRLRGDLHDGLGPQLAALTLTLDAVRNLLHRDPDAAETLVTAAKADVVTAVEDVRRVVHDLRPPALDELGLLGAVGQQVQRFRRTEPGAEGLDVQLDVAQELPVLPAAVEVAAYRIVSEALTNVARHAAARSACVRIRCRGGALELEVVDDGRGIAEGARRGVGTASMRERAGELGGLVTVTRRPGGGTAVRAVLPVGVP
jgi:signal transduction histidine kinase